VHFAGVGTHRAASSESPLLIDGVENGGETSHRLREEERIHASDDG
jgi:hypothetical protein